jgi:arsenate reductase
MIILYGIKSCDTCRKALKWLDSEGIAHRFHDLRADGLTAAKVASWVKARGWENVLNRRSTTWRELPEAARENIDARAATALMVKHPTLVKRPVFETGKEILIGFDAATRAALAGS